METLATAPPFRAAIHYHRIPALSIVSTSFFLLLNHQLITSYSVLLPFFNLQLITSDRYLSRSSL